jgi:arylsulfatase A-like enzyme
MIKTMMRWVMSLGTLVCVLGWGRLAAADESRLRPNILMIMADDVSPDHFGCYGGAATPNLDRLASRGIRFTRAWATPLCMPTRAMMLTGRYAHQNGVWHNALWTLPEGRNARQFPRYNLTVAKMLSQAGYATALAGKIHALSDPLNADAGFDEACYHDAHARHPVAAGFDGASESKDPPPGWTAPVTSRYWHPCIIRNNELMDTGPEDFGDDLFAGFLIDFMKRKRAEGTPFLAYFSMNLPHTIAAKSPDRPPLPTTPAEGIPGANNGGTIEACVAYVDTLVGRMVQAVEDMGGKDDTIILFFSDNATQWRGKGAATQQAVHVPLVVAGPERWISARGASDALVSVADLMPTFASWSGAVLPDGYGFDGISQADYLAGRSAPQREFLYSYIGTARMIRDADWILEAVDPIGGHPDGRLYRDTEKGLREIKDLKADAGAEAARQRLLAALKDIPHLDLSDPGVRSDLERYQQHGVYRHRLR